MKDAAAVYDFHPLSLSKLVEVLHYDIAKPDDIRQAPRYDVTVDLKARKDHILERAYEVLPREVRQFVSSLAALRGKATIEIARFLAQDWTDTLLSANVKRLENDRWLSWDRDTQTLDFHPIVRRYALRRLEAKEEVHARLADYFRPFADAVETERVESISDLAPVIELYHHTVHAGSYDKAYQLYREKLIGQLHFHLGVYQTQVELLSSLFPDGKDHPPGLKGENARSDALNNLAISYSLSGQSSQALPLKRLCVHLVKKRGDTKNLAISLGNLAIEQVHLGYLAAAERDLQRSLELWAPTGDPNAERDRVYYVSLLAYIGDFQRCEESLVSAEKVFRQCDSKEWVGKTHSYRALCALLKGDAKAALVAARKARGLADVRAYAFDIIWAECLLGATHCALGHLLEAETHLTEALTRCRRINLVELEPDILLAWAQWHHAKGNKDEALEHAQEALAIADRCEYRLKQADIHNFLAKMTFDEGEKDKAREEAEIAYERAWCDGPPHCYKPALDEAERLLKELGMGPPKVV